MNQLCLVLFNVFQNRGDDLNDFLAERDSYYAEDGNEMDFYEEIPKSIVSIKRSSWSLSSFTLQETTNNLLGYSKSSLIIQVQILQKENALIKSLLRDQNPGVEKSQPSDSEDLVGNPIMKALERI